jgi:hypothetical protein
MLLAASKPAADADVENIQVGHSPRMICYGALASAGPFHFRTHDPLAWPTKVQCLNLKRKMENSPKPSK